MAPRLSEAYDKANLADRIAAFGGCCALQPARGQGDGRDGLGELPGGGGGP